ncbi:Hsp20 family protein [Siccirubricoccus deserti]
MEKLGEDEYRVTLAVAGFHEDELTVTARQNMLVVAGDRRDREGRATVRTVEVARSCTAASPRAPLSAGSNWPTTWSWWAPACPTAC